MELLCYNKGCGLKFHSDTNRDDSCLFHPGVPIFHDALKGWSCCRKRTTDFSDFLSIKGCSRGRHSAEKPSAPLRPAVSSGKGGSAPANGPEIIYRGPRSAEALQRDRPSSDKAKAALPLKAAPALLTALQNLDLSRQAAKEKQESQGVIPGTRCKNTGCKVVYEGPETDAGLCTHHPGGPVFHEGYKYWSCCCIKTIDFNAFLDQKGCCTGKHRWVPKQDKKKVACRYDWHQTGSNVVVTIYAKNANPQLSIIEANGTVLSCLIQFEDNKVFKRDFHLWGVVDVPQSSVLLVPSKVEVTLQKADQVSWGKLEDPNHKPEPDPEESGSSEALQADWDIEDDDISDSDEEWAYDTAQNREQGHAHRERAGPEEAQERRKEVEEEMRRATEERKRAEEERKKMEEQRNQEEQGEYEDMPELE